MRFAFSLLLLCLASTLVSQNFRYELSGATTGRIPAITASDFSFFITLDSGAVWPANLLITFRNEREGQSFSVLPDDHSPGGKMSVLGFAPRNLNRFNVELPAGITATLHIYDPGLTTVPLRPVYENNASTATCAQPPVITRDNWCPASNCDPVAPAAPTEVTHLIVHHSAGTNTATDWAAVVRAIRNAHVNGNGWDDVGYNYLIDPNGMIYVGRGNDTRGAHFCGDNTGTMGTCMLGDFTNQVPTNAALRSLEQLLAWKAADRNIDPLGTSFHAAGEQLLTNIAGHRQGCSTACPGDLFFPLFGQLRQDVADTLAICSPLSVTENAENRLFFYPNPSRGDVQISGIVGAGELSVYTISGQLILQQQVENGDFIEAISFKGAGVYFAAFRNQKGTSVQKLIRR